jgi:hypothetical protein
MFVFHYRLKDSDIELNNDKKLNVEQLWFGEKCATSGPLIYVNAHELPDVSRVRG